MFLKHYKEIINSFYILEIRIASLSITQNPETIKENTFYIIKNFVNKAEVQVTNWGKHLQCIKKRDAKSCCRWMGQQEGGEGCKKGN